MSNKTIQLVIVTQEKVQLEKAVASVTLQTTQGQITVLPGHIPLFAKLEVGELTYRFHNGTEMVTEHFALSGGFLDVNPDGIATVLADHAIRAGEINLAQVEEAKRQAEEAMQNKESEREFKLAEASLKQALNELRVAQKRQKTGNPRV